MLGKDISFNVEFEPDEGLLPYIKPAVLAGLGAAGLLGARALHKRRQGPR